MDKKKVILVVGIRPNYMKASPLYKELKSSKLIDPILVHTGQHYDYKMSQKFFDDLNLPKPDYFLDTRSGSHSEQTAKMMLKFEKVVFNENPALVVVFGDGNTTLAATIAAKKALIPVAHVEAGLRSFDETMPEEINRRSTDHMSDYLFTPSKGANKHLKSEGLDEKKIFFVGNIMIDSLKNELTKIEKIEDEILEKHRLIKGNYCLVTLHRPSNVDKKIKLTQIVKKLNKLSKEIIIVFPIHPRTQKTLDDYKLKLRKTIIKTKPLGYTEFTTLEKNARFVLTDSGGIQEETTYLKVPCLTLRPNTERPITIEMGTNKLINDNQLLRESKKLVNNSEMKSKIPKYWDGKTSKRITDILEKVVSGKGEAMKKKILIISDFYQPYIGYSKVTVAKKLIEKGYNVRVLTSNKFFPFPDYDNTVGSVLGNRMRNIGFKMEEGIPIERKKIVFELFARGLFLGINEAIKRYKPDIVILFVVSSFSSIQVAYYKKKYNFKLVLVDTHLPSEYERGNKLFKTIFYGAFRSLFSNMISKAADKIIAAQEGTIDIIKNVYGINKKVNLIDQGTDLEKFYFDKSQRSKIRKKYKLKESDFVMLYPGKIIEAKGVHLLFEAFAKLTKEHKNIYLCIVGSGDRDYVEKCKKSIPKGKKNKVIWFDFQPQEELYKYYSFSDVGVWPLQEALSMNDCAACERPFIAMDEVTSKKRFSNNNALMYKKGSVDDLVAKIEFLYKNPKKRKEMGKRGRELVEKELSWEKIAIKYIDV